jgi:ubiquinone/menaquinone biosynthesis C-methylase UbiE
MATIYEDGTYAALHPSWHVEDSEWKARQIAKIMARNDLRPQTVCEIGCGAGEVLTQLSAKIGRDVSFEGWEVSDAAYELCRQRSSENIRFHFGDLFASGSDRYYDIIMAIDVVEHIEGYIEFLQKLKKVARYKILHIPLDLSVYAILRNYPMESRRSSGHLHYFTKDTALATLQYAGYRISDHMYTAGSNELKGNPGLIRAILKYPRKIGFRVSVDWTVRILGGYALLVLAE